jgi:hypothetical protein
MDDKPGREIITIVASRSPVPSLAGFSTAISAADFITRIQELQAVEARVEADGGTTRLVTEGAPGQAAAIARVTLTHK